MPASISHDVAMRNQLIGFFGFEFMASKLKWQDNKKYHKLRGSREVHALKEWDGPGFHGYWVSGCVLRPHDDRLYNEDTYESNLMCIS